MKKIVLVSLGIIVAAIGQAQRSPFTNYIDSNWVMEGPDAPDVQLGIQGNDIKIDISNAPISNNFNETYHVIDTSIQNGSQSFLFQGYIVYQALNSSINPTTSFFDTSKMRVVAQSDIQDNADTLTNVYLDTILNNCVGAHMVDGNNQGIQHTYLINQDAFSGSPFQPGNTYCYYVFAYAYNGNKIGKDCNLPWPFWTSFKSASGGGQQASCITFHPTSVDEFSDKLGITFYPNPTKENIHIEFASREEFVTVKIVSVSGQKIVEKRYENSREINLKIDEIDPGIYFTQITTGKGQRAIKFIKQ